MNDAELVELRRNGHLAGHALAFFREFLKEPKQVGSVVPSSSFLKRRLVRVSALGYRTVSSEILELATGDESQVEVRLVTEAIDLQPITVTARSRSPLNEIALRGYYDRRDAGRRIGMGRFYDRGEIVKMGTRLTDVLTRVPGLRIYDMGSCKIIGLTGNPTGTARLTPSRLGSMECQPPRGICPAAVYLDGLLFKSDNVGSFDQMIPHDWIEAIEVYRRAAEMPAEFLGSGACGVVAVWTRHG